MGVGTILNYCTLEPKQNFANNYEKYKKSTEKINPNKGFEKGKEAESYLREKKNNFPREKRWQSDLAERSSYRT